MKSRFFHLCLSLCLFAACLAATGNPLQAQDDPAGEDPPVAVKPDSADGENVLERLIFLPYRNLKTAFEKESATVIMPYLEYLRLWQQNGGMPVRGGKPPVAAVITESHYAASIDKDLAKITATLTVRVLDKPWAEVPVQFGAAAVGKITSADDKVLLRGTGNGRYSLLLPEIGEHKVVLELTARIRTSPDGRSFELQCPTVGITTFELAIPEADQTVVISPRLVSLPVKAAEGETRVKANLGSTAKIAANWHPRVGVKPDMDLLAAVTNHTRVSIADGLVHTDTFLQYDILRGELPQARIAVPLGHRILDVSAPEAKVKGWKTEVQENQQLVTVELLSNVRQKLVIEVHTERPVPEATFAVAGIDDDGTVHGIHAIDAVRESGQLAVTHGADLKLTVDKQQGLTRIREEEVSPLIRLAGALSYKFYSTKFQLAVSTRPVEPRIVVKHVAQLIFSEDELQLRAAIQYTVDRAGVFQLTLQLPDDLEVDDVNATGMKEFNVDENTRILTVSLNEKRQGAIALSFTGHRNLDVEAEEAEHALPLLEPQQAERETGEIYVFAPPGIEVITDEDQLVGVQAAPTRAQTPNANVRLVSAWTFSRRPIEINVKTKRKPTRLTARIGTTLNVRQERVEVKSTVEYLVEHAGLDTFRLSVPESVSDVIQIESATAGRAIKQRSPDEEAVEGRITWTVVMQQKVLGRQRFEITYNLPRAPADEPPVAPDGGDTQIVFDPPQVLGLPGEDEADSDAVVLSSLTGELAVLKDRALSVSAAVTGEDAELIDVRELKFLPQNGALAYRYFKQPVELKIDVQKHDIQEVVETVVSRALVEIVVGQDAVATYRCRYKINSSERQRLRLALPANAEILGALVNNSRVNLEKDEEGEDAYFVNIARSNNSNEAFYLTLQFFWRINPPPFSSPGQQLLLPLPKIGGDDAAQVAVQQLRTVVWVPEKYALVGTPDRFVKDTGNEDPDQWIGFQESGIFDFPKPKHGTLYSYSSLGAAQELQVTAWETWFLTALLSAAVVLIGVVLRNTPWENKLTFTLLLGFAATLYSLIDADVVSHFAFAARYGIVAVVAYWVVHSLFRSPAARSSRAAAVTPAAAVIPPPGVFEMVLPGKKKK